MTRPAGPRQQPQEEGRAQAGGDDAERNLDRGQGAGQEVDGDQEAGTQEEAKGRRRLKSGPISRRATCGMTRPIQPMIPLTETAAAVIKVAAAISVARSRPASTPSARASSSPKVRTFTRQRRR